MQSFQIYSSWYFANARQGWRKQWRRKKNNIILVSGNCHCKRCITLFSDFWGAFFWLGWQSVEQKDVLWVCDFDAAVGLLLFKSSHYWKVISKTKSQPQRSMVKRGGREEYKEETPRGKIRKEDTKSGRWGGGRKGGCRFVSLVS